MKRPASLIEGAIVGGGYRVIRPIAAGGMGAIFEVEQIATGARRALKTMSVALARDARLRARFVQEARLGAAIASDHVAGVLDAGVDDATGLPYLVMELLDGATLSRELRRRGPFAWPDARAIMKQIGHALGAAHAAGVVHRDLKPANVFLAASKSPGVPFVAKVLDFGIARIAASATDGVTSIIGTPAWMAPEQTEHGVPVGPPADVWAYGLLAFTVLTARSYWPTAEAGESSTAAVIRDVVLSPIVAASTRAAGYECAERLPPGFDAWFARCVDRDPANRFADARDASAAFDALIAAALGPEPPGGHTLAPLAPPTERAVQMVTADEEISTQSPTRPVGAAARRARAVAWMRGAVALVALVAFGLVVAFTRLRPTRAGVAPVDAAPPEPPRATVIARVHGSNTIGAELAPALAEAFLKRRTGATSAQRRRTAPDEMIVEARGFDRTEAIEIHAHGSSTAFTDLASGACDVGMASRRIRAPEIEALAALGPMASAASEHVIALDGIAVIVNPQSPVTVLTKQQLAQIFGGDLARWSGASGPDAPIVVHARDDRSGTFDTFKALALGGRPLAPGARRHESSEELADAVAADVNAIGFVGLAYVRSAKAVMVRDASSAPLLPSPATVSTEDYPLARRLYFYAAPSAPEPARRFVDFAVSDEGQTVARAAGFVDLLPECDAAPPKCATCSAEYRTAVAGACRLSIDFRFDSASKQLDTRALRDLARLASMLERPDTARRSLLLLGFSDAQGSRADNARLSLDRATIVADQLRARGLAVAAVKGFGQEMPVGDNATEEGRERNRRVEVWLR